FDFVDAQLRVYDGESEPPDARRPVGAENSSGHAELGFRSSIWSAWSASVRIAAWPLLSSGAARDRSVGPAWPRGSFQGCRDSRLATSARGVAPPDRPPRFEPDDRAILAALARVLGRDRWSIMVVKPDANLSP